MKGLLREKKKKQPLYTQEEVKTYQEKITQEKKRA